MTPTAEPRHFWRRILALMVDGFLASILAMLLMLPLVKAAPEKLQYSEGLVRFAICQKITSLPDHLVTFIDGREVPRAQFCVYRPNLVFPTQYKAEIQILEPQVEGQSVRRKIDLEIDTLQDGELIEPIKIDEELSILLLLLVSALYLARKTPTPGKALMGLRISGEGCALCREIRRLGPFVVLSFGDLALRLFGVGFHVTGAMALTLIVPLIAVYFYYYLWPLLRWSGASRYDRATGFQVVRKTDYPTITP